MRGGRRLLSRSGVTIETHLIRLTAAQTRLLYWLRRELPRTSLPLTLDAACAALGLASRGSLHKHVSALVAAGLVEPLQGRQRGIALTAAGWGEAAAAAPGEAGGVTLVREPEHARERAPTLPLLGRVAAGRPIDAIEGEERVPVPAPWADDARCYALTVRGESMRDDGIHDGDTVIVESRVQARHGEVVVALIDGSEATLKRFELRGGEVVLHPANEAMQPLVFDARRVTIRGVVRGLIRRY